MTSSPIPAPHAPSPPHAETALGSGEPLHTRSRFVAVPGITHYLPQANVARDGQSEGQCNVLHGLSHGSVQNPANTEVPPTAEPCGDRGKARPATAARRGHSPPPERTETRLGTRGRRGSPVLPAFLSLPKNRQTKHFPRLGS